MAQTETFPALTCRKCCTANPQIYFAPVVVSESGTCCRVALKGEMTNPTKSMGEWTEHGGRRR